MKLPRDISGSEAVKALQRLGFQFIDQEGSHIKMAKGPWRVTVPNHREISPGTLKSMLRQAQVSVDQFVAAL